ncbi:MAG: YitT family protein [Thomasclavelia sp.]|nr:YitT family protein [Thomasclavelia sp.]
MNRIKSLIIIIIGNTILAFGVACFTLPANIVVGGTTGLALLGKYFFNLKIANTVLICNVILFICGYLGLGKKFALTTLLSTIIYPFILEFFQSIAVLQNLSNDILLSTLFSGLLSGVGIGLVIKAGASTGGMDIPPLIINNKFGIPVSISMYAFDMVIILSLAFIYKPIYLLYGILSTIIMTYTINEVLLFGRNNIQILVFSNKHEEIRDALLKDLNLGVSMLKMETGYTREDSKAVLCIVGQRRLTEVKKIIQDIDPVAFMAISNTKEVRGVGFTLSREYAKENI